MPLYVERYLVIPQIVLETFEQYIYLMLAILKTQTFLVFGQAKDIVL